MKKNVGTELGLKSDCYIRGRSSPEVDNIKKSLD